MHVDKSFEKIQAGVRPPPSWQCLYFGNIWYCNPSLIKLIIYPGDPRLLIFIVVRQKPKSASHRINPEKIMGGEQLFAPAFVFPSGDQSCCSVSSSRNCRLIYSSSSPQSFSGRRPTICARQRDRLLPHH